MKKSLVIINDAHTLLEDQERVLDEKFGPEGWERLNIPIEGLNLVQMEELCHKLNGEDVVFASPIPYLVMRLSTAAVQWWAYEGGSASTPPSINVRVVYVLHNDHRVAKEVPDGKGGVRMIHTVSPTGWVLV